MSTVVGSLVFEVVGDLTDLEKSLSAADKKAAASARNIETSLNKIEASQRKAAGAAQAGVTASDRLTQANDRLVAAAQKGAGASAQLAAGQQRLVQAYNDNAKAAGQFYDAQGRLRDAMGRYVSEAGNGAGASQRLSQGFDMLSGSSVAANTNVGRLAAGVAFLGTLGVGAGLIAAARGIAQAGDEFTGYRNKLIVAGEGQQTLNQRLDELVQVALRSRTALAPVMELYGGIRKSTEDLGKSQGDVQRVTETITKAFAASGTSAATAAGAILQLNQAFASGTLRGEELNSVLEGAPALARLIAKEFGIGMGELKSFGEEGKLSADRVFEAFLSGSKEVDTTFNATATTISQASANAGTSIAQLGAELDSLLGFAARAVAGLNAVAGAIQNVSARVRSFGEGVQQARIDNLAATIKNLEDTEIPFLTSARETAGLKQATENLTRFRAEYDKLVTARVDSMVPKPPEILLNADGLLTTARASRTAQKAFEDLTEAQTKVARDAMTPLARSIEDANKAFADRQKVAEQMRKDGVENTKIANYETASQKLLADAIKNANSAAASKGGGKSGESSSSASDSYDTAVQRIKDQIAELKLQEEQASKTGRALYELEAANRLRRAAAQAGRADEAGLADAISATAKAYAEQKAATDAAIEGQRRLQESIKYTGDLLSSFVDDILTGSLDQALKSLGKSFLSASLDAFISGKGPFAGISGMAPADKNSQGGILGLLTSLPKEVREGAAKGSATGTSAGILSISQEGGGGLLTGALNIDGKALAGGLTAIAGLAGAYGVGMSAGSVGQAVGGGALSGAMAGAGLASALGMAGNLALPGVGLVIGAGLAPVGNRSIKRKEFERERAKRHRQFAEGMAAFRQQRL